MFPNIAWETTFVGIVAFDTFVIGAGTYLFFKPKWWHVALVGGAAITGATAYAVLKPAAGASVFVVSAMALAITSFSSWRQACTYSCAYGKKPEPKKTESGGETTK